MNFRERASEDASSRDVLSQDSTGRGLEAAEKLVKTLTERGRTIAAAESCTAGLASDFIARVPGASKVLWGSFVVYTPDAKEKMLGVSSELLAKYGPVSRPVALSMAEEALKKSGAAFAFSVTGYAGPAGQEGTFQEGVSPVPVGTVWIGMTGRDSQGRIRAEAEMYSFTGDRNEVREKAAVSALEMLLEYIDRGEL